MAMQSSCQRNLERKRHLQGIDRPCGKNAAEIRSPLKEKSLSRG